MNKQILITLLFCTISPYAFSQNNALEQYNQFKQQVQNKYSDFRNKCNAEYAEFLKQAWESYQAGPIIPKPKDEIVPPVVMPEEYINNPVEPKLVPIDTIMPPIIEETEPQPKPVAPIYESPQPTENFLSFMFYGTEGKVRVPAVKPKLLESFGNTTSTKKVGDLWNVLSGGEYDNLMRDCLELRIRYSLCDWAYLQMIRELSETYCGGRNNASVVFMSWIFCQTGYQMRFASTNNKLYLLFGSKHRIYDMGYYVVDGIHFYPFLHDGEADIKNAQISRTSFPEEKPLSLYLPYAQSFTEVYGENRTIASERYPSVKASVKVNQNLMKFYSSYPTSMIGENVATRWAIYANTPMAKSIKEQLYPQLRAFISGKSQLDAVNILLNWVQTGFVYEYDDKVWGGDRAFFAEESLNYPYCDCEDRSILFTRLVRDLLGLNCILVFYPGHLAAAVNFTDQVSGDYILLGGKRFVVTDPTYIGAPVGYTMSDMDNATAIVILLE